MSLQPLLSVVMSVYNNAAHLRQAIDSILAQTFSDFELIIVNDGSTDSSFAALNEYARQDQRIVLIDQENTGLTRALVRGCNLARGELIARHDADDWSHPERFQRQVAFLEAQPQVGFLASATRYVGPAGEPLEMLTRSADPEIATHGLQFRREGPPAHGGMMFRTSIYKQAGGYRHEFYLGQDSDLWLRMVDLTLFACIEQESYYFRRHADSVSSMHRQMQRAFGVLGHACRSARHQHASEEPVLKEAAMLTEKLLLLRKSGLKPQEDLELNYMIGSRLAVDRNPSAARYLWPVVRRRPWHGRAWLRLLQSYLPAGSRTDAGTSDDAS